MNKFILIISLLLPLFLLGNLANAQELGIPDFGSEFETRVVPEYPGPNTKVNITTENYSTDLTRANFKWNIDGKLVLSGAGERTFSFATAGLGIRREVLLQVTSSEGRTFSKKFVFIPAVVDMLYQADSYTHPFYAGKAMPNSEGDVMVIALPIFSQSGKRLSPAGLYYTWSRNFEPVTQASGLGKNTYPLKISSIFGETNVKVVVKNTDGSLGAVGLLVLKPSNPEVLVYVDAPLSGTIYSNPITNSIKLTGDEVSLRAVDYFFPKSHRTKTANKSGLTYIWTLNGKQAVVDETTPDILTLRQNQNENTGSGQAGVAVSVRDPFDSLISAARGFMIEFGGGSNSSNSFQ